MNSRLFLRAALAFFVAFTSFLSVACHDKHEDRYEDYDNDRVRVRAPFVDVRVGDDDRVRVNAPGTNVDTDRDDDRYDDDYDDDDYDD